MKHLTLLLLLSLCFCLTTGRLTDHQDVVEEDNNIFTHNHKHSEAWEQYKLAEEFRNGAMNVSKDIKKAIAILEHVALMNDQYAAGAALASLGKLYLYGDRDCFLEPNITYAIRLLNQSAELGNPQGQHMMAVFYSVGIPKLVTKDTKKSIIYDYFASLSGEYRASMSLGFRHMYGIGVPKSCLASLRYYSIAAEKAVENLPPIFSLSRPFVRLKDLSTVYSTGYSANLEKEDLQYYYSKSEKSSKLTMMNLIASGGNLAKTRDYQEAIQLLEKAVEKGDSEALAYLGHSYAYGYGVLKDVKKAKELYTEASERGIAEGQNGLGLLYLNGLGVPIDREYALKLFLKATDEGHPDGVYNAGRILETINPAKAIRHYEAAARAGHIKSTYRLGRMIEKGVGTLPSCIRSLKYFKKTAEQGFWKHDLHKALEHSLKGSDDISLLFYLQLSIEGYEVAQSNAAYLIDEFRGTKLWNKKIILENLSIELTKYAALQGNSHSRVKIGDIYYYGTSETNPDPVKAAIEYRIASGSRNAQAMFNLGYMYEYGIGVPQSRDQAIIYYEMCKISNRYAFIPINLVLFHLQLKKWFPSITRIVNILYSTFFSNLIPTPTQSQSQSQSNDKIYDKSMKAINLSTERNNWYSIFSSILSSKLFSSSEISLSEVITAIHFDAQTTIKVSPTSILLEESPPLDAFTIEGWIYIDGKSGSKGYIVSLEKSVGVCIVQENNGFRLESFLDMKKVAGNTLLEENRWYHVAVTKHTNYHAVFINGKMDGVRKNLETYDKNRLLNSINGEIFVGSNRGREDYFNGKIAELRIWNQVKSKDELQKNMKRKVSASRKELLMYMDLSKNNLQDVKTDGIRSYQDLYEQSNFKRKIRVYGKTFLEKVYFPSITENN